MAGGRVAQVGGAVERASAVTVGGTGGGTGGDPTGVTRAQVLRYRVHAPQLGRTPTTERLATDADVLDLGVQDSGAGGSAWALANRGLKISADPARWPSTLALAWTLRGAPHTYRRSDLDGVEVAVRPFSEADAGRRTYDANKPLRAAGIPATQALETVATQLRRIVAAPTAKGTASTALTAAIDDGRTSAGAARAGPRTCSRCRSGSRRCTGASSSSPEPRPRWPAASPDDAGPVRLLGPFDLFLQARDRDPLVPDTDRQPGLWPTLGRPGAVLAGADIVGTWRPRASGRRLRILLDPWVPWDEPLHDAVAQQSARLAEHRGLDLEAVTR